MTERKRRDSCEAFLLLPGAVGLIMSISQKGKLGGGGSEGDRDGMGSSGTRKPCVLTIPPPASPAPASGSPPPPLCQETL